MASVAAAQGQAHKKRAAPLVKTEAMFVAERQNGRVLDRIWSEREPDSFRVSNLTHIISEFQSTRIKEIRVPANFLASVFFIFAFLQSNVLLRRYYK